MRAPYKSLMLLKSFNGVCPECDAQPAEQRTKAGKENNRRQTGAPREQGGHCVFSALSDRANGLCDTLQTHTHTQILTLLYLWDS